MMVGLAESQYDVRFRLLGVPVRIHPFFWLITAIMGFQAYDNDIPAVLLWIGCVFVSILVHEFGHALATKAFFGSPSVVLWGMGGLCYNQGEQQTPRQRLAIILAGPGAGFLLCALVVLLFWILLGITPYEQAQLVSYEFSLSQTPGTGLDKFVRAFLLHREQGQFVFNVYWFLVQINLFWGLVNLLPVWPLDGGQATQILLTFYDRARGQRWGHVVSLLVAGAVALIAYSTTERLFLTLFFGYFALVNYQVLQSLHQAHSMGLYQDDEWWRK
jgi:stage IV sporulation protein FB